MTTLEFLTCLYGNVSDGYVSSSYIKNGSIITKWFSITELSAMAAFIENAGKKFNTYYGINPRKKELSSYERGTDSDVKCVIGVYADFDVKGAAHKQKALPESRDELNQFIEQLPYQPTITVWSGNGIHAIWLFETPYVLTDDSSYVNGILKGWESFIKNQAKERHGWIFDSVADTARMLRAPNTVNFKTDEHKRCEVLSMGGSRYSLTAFEKYAVSNNSVISSSEEISTADEFALMGTGSAEELVRQCDFLQHCKMDAATLPEPEWQAMISNLACTADGKEMIHELSSPYPRYSYVETERKYLNAVKQDKPITCKRIHEVFGFQCQKNCDVKAPIALIRDYANQTQEVKWEEPIPFEQFILPEFPVDALPKPISDYVMALAESTQTPIDMAASCALAILAVCLQGKYQIQAKADWAEPLNLFVLNVMEPSERKSAVENAMARPINLYEAEQNSSKAVEIEKSKTRKQILEQRQRSLVTQAAKGKADMEEVDRVAEEIAIFQEVRPLKLYVDDITTEKLTSVLADNDGRTAILSTEGGIFDTLSGIYTKNVNIDVILKGYSGDSIRVDRIGRQSESIMNPALTMLLMAQPSVLSGLMGNGTFRGRGLTARFLYCIPRSKVGSRKYRSEAVPISVYSNYERCIRNLLEDEYQKQPERITLSPEADRLIEAYAEALEPLLRTEYSDITDWAGKLIGNTLRIAGLLCRASVYRDHSLLAVNNPLEVSEEVMKNAIRIGRYFTEHARAAFSLMGADETVKLSKYVMKAIRESGLSELTRRDIQRMCRSFKKANDLQPILDNLVDYGYLAVDDTGTYAGKGRPPAMKYRVNPYVYQEQE